MSARLPASFAAAILLAVAAALGAAPATVAAAPAALPESPAPAAERPALVPLPEPILEGIDPDVAEQLRTLRREIDDELAAPTVADPELAEKLGDLGALYDFFGFSAPAEAALASARALAPGDFRWPYLAALVRHKAGDLDRAAGDYEAALAMRPIYAPALVRLGEARLAQRRLDDAEELFERALAVHPSHAAARFGLGRVAAERGDDAAAAGHFEAVLDLQPQASSVRYPLAQVYRRLGRLDDARAALAAVGSTEVTMPDPVLLHVQGLATGSSVHFVRGRRALARGDYATAIDELRRATEADAGHVEARRALGLARHRGGDPAGAAEEFRAAIELDPSNPLNHQDLALVLLDVDADEEAVERFRRALDLDPTYAEAHQGLAVALGRLGRHDEALSHLDRALGLDPTNAAVRFERAMSLLRLGRRDDAVAALAEVMAADPGHASALANLAALHEGAGDLEGAAREAAAALDLDPPGPLAARARLILGRIEERRGAPSRAAEHYAAAAALDPALPPAHFRLASARAATGDPAGAAASYAAGLAVAPDFRPARLALASVLIRAGRDAEARDTLVEGLTRRSARRPGGGGDPALARSAGLLLAGSDDPAVRDPGRALELARDAYATAPGPATGQVLALALAAGGRFEEAERAQGRLVAALEQAGQAAPLDAARRRLALYQHGEPARAPWRDDPALLDPITLPLPPTVGDEEELP